MQLADQEVVELKERIALARESLVSLRYYLLSNGTDEVDPASFHFQWSDILLRGDGNFAVEGFRESGKGQIVLRAFPLYCLAFPSVDRDYIVLIKENATLAQNKLLEIEDEYLSNPTLCSNLVEVKVKSAKIFSVIVQDEEGNKINVRIETYGKGSAIRGLANIDRRPKICVIDDPQSLEDSRSDTVLKNDWLWFLSDVKFLGQHTRIFLIGNNLGEKCIIERVFANPGEVNFHIQKVTILNKEGLPAWPEKFPIEFIRKERQNYRNLGQLGVWLRERMCEAISPENRVFNLLDFVRYSYLYLDKITVNCNFFITVDGASSKDPGACYRAICVNAVAEDNRWIIVDFPYGRWGADVFIDQLFDTVVKWVPYNGANRRITVGIEKGWFKQILEPFIHKEMQKRNVYFTIVPIEHAKAGNKLERVKMIAPRAAAHSILLPENAAWLPELETEIEGTAQDGFKSLYVDLLDALSMQNQIAKPPVIQGRQSNRTIEQVTNFNPLTGQYTQQKQVGNYDPMKI